MSERDWITASYKGSADGSWDWIFPCGCTILPGCADSAQDDPEILFCNLHANAGAKLPCGHPGACAVGRPEWPGAEVVTMHCAWCEDIARLKEAKTAESNPSDSG